MHESDFAGESVRTNAGLRSLNAIAARHGLTVIEDGPQSDDEWAEQMRAIRTHGEILRYQHHHPLGMNGRFDTLQAAVLLAKWRHFAGEVEARSRIGARYTERLQDIGVTPCVLPGHTHVYAQYTIRVAEWERVAEALKAQGIPTAVYNPKCLHEQPVFEPLGYRWGDFPEAERASREVLSLPM